MYFRFKHKNVLYFYLLLNILIWLIDKFTNIPIYIYLILFISFLIIEVCGSLIISWEYHIDSIHSLSENQKRVAISFDDGPHSVYTPKVLDLLKKYNCRAHFFIIGKNIMGKESILDRILKEGHILGNHSYSHSYSFGFWSKAKVKLDIEKCSEELQKCSGKKSSFFRPPFGVTNPNIAFACEKLQLQVIGWNLRSLDTVLKNPNLVVQRIKRKVKNGSIILFHDSLPNMEWILEQVLEFLKDQNYEIVTLREN